MRTPLLVVAIVAATFATPAAAQAVSVAYIDNGEVWVSSLDGASKARLASPVVNSEGVTEKWLDVAQSDGGRIVAVRNVPGRISRFSWFKIWEPDGTSTVEGPLNAPSGWSIYVYPVGFDITADGKTLVYGFSNSRCCNAGGFSDFETGTYVRPATNSVLDPIKISGQQWPSLVGDRVVAASGNTVTLQDPGSTYGPDFTPWLDFSGVPAGVDLHVTDVAATAPLAASEFEQRDSGTVTFAAITIYSVAGLGGAQTGAVLCDIPAAGFPAEGSLSPDGTRFAWRDNGGVKVAGTPTTNADPCVFTSAPAAISPTGSHPSIGGANVAVFLPPPPPPPPPTPTPPPPPTTTPAPSTPPATTLAPAPLITIPAKLTAKALAAAKGVRFKVKVRRAGKITVTATVPASRMGRKGTKPVVVARGSTTARKAGTVTVRLRFTAAARKRVKRLRGAKLKLRVVQGGRASTKSVKLR